MKTNGIFKLGLKSAKAALILSALLAILAIFNFQTSSEKTSAADENLVNPLTVPAPVVKLTAPNEALIGEEFSFTVSFANTGDIGYGPFVDVVLPAFGIDGNIGGPCDGISFVKAEMVGINGGPLPLPTSANLATPCGGASNPVTHPFNNDNGIAAVSVPTGAQLVTIELPFGSFASTQPAVEIVITVKLHQFADVGAANKLPIYARGGFRFGATALNEFSTDPPIFSNGGTSANSASWTEKKEVIPTVYTISKKYLGPEDEAVSGANFIDYYPLQYQITVNIANLQKITNLVIDDCVQNNAVLVGSPISTPAASSSTATSNQCFKLDYKSITGTLSDKDVSVIADFYISKFVEGSKKPVLEPKSCDNATSTNEVESYGDWTPLDPRDVPVPPDPPTISVGGNASYTITAKRMAIQKSVTVKIDKGNGLVDKNDAPIPGDYLEYKLRFQVSDYFTFGNIVIEDILSDGQEFVQSSPATAANFRVTDRFGTTTDKFNTFIKEDKNQKVNCKAVKGGTRLTFLLSDAMINAGSGVTRHNLGILTGGAAFAPVSNVPAEGEIIFYVKINDAFDFQGSGKEMFVDKLDPLNNCVTISGDIYENTDQKPESFKKRCSDDSSTSQNIKPGILEKNIIARNNKPLTGFNNLNPPSFSGGDTITFSIKKTIFSGDWEKLTIKDWIPLPALDATFTNLSGPISVCGGSGYPPAGQICLGPWDNVGSPITPVIFDPTDSKITFDYGTQNNPANTVKIIELRFTLKVTNKPYADGLFFTNEAQECEFNTFKLEICQTAVARFILTEPNVRIRKGVVSSSNPNSLYTPNVPTIFTSGSGYKPPRGIIGNICPTGSCPRYWNWSGNVTSTLLTNPNFLNNDLQTADANDSITFAIVLENVGSGLNGAWDVRIKDTQDPVFLPPNISSNIQANEGVNPSGNLIIPLPNTPSFVNIVSLMAGGKTLTRTLPTLPSLFPRNLTNGRNIAVLTYDTKLANQSTVKIGKCYKNTATLLNYAATPGGPNFVAANFTPDFSDTAKVCINPTLTKSVVKTSEAHTQPDFSTTPQTAANTPKVTIGEIVRYRLTVRVPEGTSTSFKVKDAIHPDMKFLNDGSSRITFIADSATGITRSSAFGSAFSTSGNESSLPSLSLNATQTVPPSVISPTNYNCGDDPTFDLGAVQNHDNDNNLEYVVIEFNALVCNVQNNQSGVSLDNRFQVLVNGETITSDPINVNVVEPNMTITKTPSSFGGTSTTPPINFIVTATNTGTTDAFDVDITDVAAGMNLGTPVITYAPAGCAVIDPSSSGLNFKYKQVKAGCVITIKVEAKLQCPGSPSNTATVKYSSLPLLNGTSPNSTDSTSGNSGASDGERNDSGNSNASTVLNNYYDSVKATGTCEGGGIPGRLFVVKNFKGLGYSLPTGQTFSMTISCLPSGHTDTKPIPFYPSLGTVTFQNIPANDKCEIKEILPPNISTQNCATVGWNPQVTFPAMSLLPYTTPTIPAGGSQQVKIENRYQCLSQSSNLLWKETDFWNSLALFSPNNY